MGISTCSVALLLVLLGSVFNSSRISSKLGIDSGDTLTVVIRKREERSGRTPDNEAVRPTPQEQVVVTKSAILPLLTAPAIPTESKAETRPLQNWHAIAIEDVKSESEAYFRQEASRASMRQKTHSMMFQPAKETLAMEEESLLSDMPYKQYSRVLGLGLNIGSCFIGIPISGVPVENRTAAISIFVCT